MAERKMWDKYEAAILLEAVLNIENNIENRSKAIERVSKHLRAMAQNRGFSIDDTYRNTNGISMQMVAMRATIFNIECKMRSHSKVFCEITNLYHTNRLEYETILGQAYNWINYNKEEQHTMREDKTTICSNKDAFSSWLQVKEIKKLSPNLIISAIEEVSEYATKHKVSKVSVWDISDENEFNDLRTKMQSMRLFRLLHKNSAKIFDMSWKYYIAFLKEKKDNEINAEETQNAILNVKTNESTTDNVERNFDIDSFYEWMTSETTMAPSSCRAYASSFRTACEYAMSNGLIFEKLYEISDSKVLKEQIEKVLQDTDFQKYNADQHNRFSAALKKYLEYRTGIILPNHTQKTVATKAAVSYPYLEQVTAVLKEHYQYGFRLESVIDM